MAQPCFFCEREDADPAHVVELRLHKIIRTKLDQRVARVRARRVPRCAACAARHGAALWRNAAVAATGAALLVAANAVWPVAPPAAAAVVGSVIGLGLVAMRVLPGFRHKPASAARQAPGVAEMLQARWSVAPPFESVPDAWLRFRKEISAAPESDHEAAIGPSELLLFTDFVGEALRQEGRKTREDAQRAFREHVVIACADKKCYWLANGNDLLAAIEADGGHPVAEPTIGMFVLRELRCPRNFMHDRLLVSWAGSADREPDPAWRSFLRGSPVRVASAKLDAFYRAVVESLKRDGLPQDAALRAFDRQAQFRCVKCHHITTGDSVAMALVMIDAAAAIGPAEHVALANAIKRNKCPGCASRKLVHEFTSATLPAHLGKLATSSGATFEARWIP